MVGEEKRRPRRPSGKRKFPTSSNISAKRIRVNSSEALEFVNLEDIPIVLENLANVSTQKKVAALSTVSALVSCRSTAAENFLGQDALLKRIAGLLADPTLPELRGQVAEIFCNVIAWLDPERGCALVANFQVLPLCIAGLDLTYQTLHITGLPTAGGCDDVTKASLHALIGLFQLYSAMCEMKGLARDIITMSVSNDGATIAGFAQTAVEIAKRSMAHWPDQLAAVSCASQAAAAHAIHALVRVLGEADSRLNSSAHKQAVLSLCTPVLDVLPNLASEAGPKGAWATALLCLSNASQHTPLRLFLSGRYNIFSDARPRKYFVMILCTLFCTAVAVEFLRYINQSKRLSVPPPSHPELPQTITDLLVLNLPALEPALRGLELLQGTSTPSAEAQKEAEAANMIATGETSAETPDILLSRATTVEIHQLIAQVEDNHARLMLLLDFAEEGLEADDDVSPFAGCLANAIKRCSAANLTNLWTNANTACAALARVQSLFVEGGVGQHFVSTVLWMAADVFRLLSSIIAEGLLGGVDSQNPLLSSDFFKVPLPAILSAMDIVNQFVPRDKKMVEGNENCSLFLDIIDLGCYVLETAAAAATVMRTGPNATLITGVDAILVETIPKISAFMQLNAAVLPETHRHWLKDSLFRVALAGVPLFLFFAQCTKRQPVIKAVLQESLQLLDSRYINVIAKALILDLIFDIFPDETYDDIFVELNALKSLQSSWMTTRPAAMKLSRSNDMVAAAIQNFPAFIQYKKSKVSQT